MWTIFLQFFFYLRKYFILIKNTAEDDLYELKLKKDQWKNIFSHLGIIKFIYLIVLLVVGIVPLLVFFYLIFFFFKYFFKYFFLTLDYFLFFLNNYSIYVGLKENINYFFLITPNILLKIYKYFFGGGWIRFFWDSFKNYWKFKWFRFLRSFFSITDDLILVKSPKIYAKSKEKSVDLYYLFIRIFFIFQRKTKDILRFFRNFFSKIWRKIKKKNRLIKRIYDKWFRKYYYLWYFWYIKTYIYYAWIFRKYIWSDAFIVTLEAFSFIAFWNFVACVKYSVALLYTRLQYIFSEIFYGLWLKIIYIEFHFLNLLEYLRYEGKGFIIDLRSYSLEFLRWLFFNISVLGGQMIYISPYAWYWWKHECYEVDKGYISLMWYSLKFYAIIQKFFRRLYPLPLRLFFFNRKIENLAFVITYEYLLRILLRRFKEGCYFMFYIKFIYFI